MKTAVSIPDALFNQTEELAVRMKTSRSRLVREALREYIDRHSPDRVTEAINAIVSDVGDDRNDFHKAAARNTLNRNEE